MDLLSAVTTYQEAVKTGDVDLFLTLQNKKCALPMTGLDTAMFIIKNGKQEKMLFLVEDVVGRIESKDFTFLTEMYLQDFVLNDDHNSIRVLIQLELNFEGFISQRFYQLLTSIVASAKMCRLLEKIGINLVSFLKCHLNLQVLNFFLYVNNRQFEVLFHFESNGIHVINKLIVNHLSLYSSWKKMYSRGFVNAADKIRYWWIPICYSMKRESGIRMAEKNYKKFEEMYLV